MLHARRQRIAVSLFQRGASQNAAFATAIPAEQHVMQRRQPRRAVLVGERNAGMHLRLIGLGVVVVALGVMPAGPLREQRANSGFAGPGHAHQNHDHDFAASFLMSARI